jgi:hypothetical protein
MACYVNLINALPSAQAGSARLSCLPPHPISPVLLAGNRRKKTDTVNVPDHKS